MTEIDLLKYLNFRSVFSRNFLPGHMHKIETGIINLDDDEGVGTHWVAYSINNNKDKYFESYGDLKLPKEVERYLLSN